MPNWIGVFGLNTVTPMSLGVEPTPERAYDAIEYDENVFLIVAGISKWAMQGDKN